jgi:Leucine-rich repeat (LRR) protein
MSFDLSYNQIKELPWDFHAGNMPYLYGVDLSFNRFEQFPFNPLDVAGLTVLAVRSQRNEKGERCLREWPQGIYQHVGLRGLYLGSNDLRKVEDTISTLCYYLDISDNPNIVFDASDICYAWQAGAYILYYDKTQRILNCDMMLE